jgi:UDP-glucose 4-epimerase
VHIDPLKDGDMMRRKPDNSDMKKMLERKLLSIDDGIKKILEVGLFEMKNYKICRELKG